MPRTRLTPGRRSPRWARGLAAVAVVSQVLGATGWVVPAARAKDAAGDLPFPCQNRPCACRTAEQCWAGKCCCFTMREKVAWAADRGLTPPAHAVRLADQELAVGADDECPHCAKAKKPLRTPDATSPPPVVKLVIGIVDLGCRGEAGAGVTASPPALPVDLAPVEVTPPAPGATVPCTPVFPPVRPVLPPVPPPKPV